MSDSPLYPPPNPERELMDLLSRLNARRAGRVLVHIHLSKLSLAYKNEPFIRIATESFATFVSGFEGQFFKMTNNDVIFVARDVTISMLEAAVDRIKILFSQEPLIENYTINGQSQFCSFYNVETDYDALLRLGADLMKEAGLRQRIVDDPMPQTKSEPVHPAVLSRIEQALETVDVSNMARRQTVCTLIDDTNPQPLFEEIYVSISDLQTIVAPGVDLGANTWLFRYLTKTLDQRIMSMLMRDGVPSQRPFSLNLNVETVLMPEFARFEAAITPQLRGRLVIEMNKLDVFADMNAFTFARDYLHDHGFRLCLDGLTHHTLPYYNRVQLGFDLLKLYWTPNALDSMLPSAFPEVRNIIMETGQAHMILCRCDDERAIQIGQDLGIVMFQGRQIDKLLSKK